MVGYSRRDVTESSDVMEKLNRYRSKKLWLCHQSVTRPETADMKSLIKNFTSISLNRVLWQLDVFHFAPSTCLPPFDWVTFTFMLWHFILIVFCLCIRDPLYNLCHDLQTPDSQWTWLNNRGKKREKKKREGWDSEAQTDQTEKGRQGWQLQGCGIKGAVRLQEDANSLPFRSRDFSWGKNKINNPLDNLVHLSTFKNRDSL